MEQLLAAGAKSEAKNEVRGGGGMRDEDREGSMGTTHLFVSHLVAFL